MEQPMKRYETERQVTNRTGISPRLLRQWRQDGTGFPYIKLGRKILYDADVVDAHLAQHTVQSTSAATVRDAEAAQ